MRLPAKLLPLLLSVAVPAAWAHENKHDVEVHVDIQQILKETKHEVEQALASLPHTPKKAFMGIILGTEKERTSKGVYVLDVSDGGAAQKAGLQRGDVITAMDGESLAPDESHGAAKKLGMILRRHKPGDSIKLTYLRDGEPRELSMVLGGRPVMSFNIDLESGDETYSMHFDSSEHGKHKRKTTKMIGADARRWGELELFELNTQLAEYFGNEKGTLVVFAGDNKLKLRGGDVVIDIDGRQTRSPAQTWRILSSYDSGEALKLNIRRKGERETLSITSP